MLSIMKDIVLAACSVVAATVLFLMLVGFGWYVVWKLFLSRFRLIREILDNINGVQPLEEPKSKSKSRKTRRD